MNLDKAAQEAHAKLCINPFNMTAHFLLPSTPPKLHELTGYCGACYIKLQLTKESHDYTMSSIPMPKTKPYKDSKINNRNFVQAGNDTL